MWLGYVFIFLALWEDVHGCIKNKNEGNLPTKQPVDEEQGKKVEKSLMDDRNDKKSAEHGCPAKLAKNPPDYPHTMVDAGTLSEGEDSDFPQYDSLIGGDAGLSKEKTGNSFVLENVYFVSGETDTESETDTDFETDTDSETSKDNIFYLDSDVDSETEESYSSTSTDSEEDNDDRTEDSDRSDTTSSTGIVNMADDTDSTEESTDTETSESGSTSNLTESGKNTTDIDESGKNTTCNVTSNKPNVVDNVSSTSRLPFF
ncbi:uncharacterized protein [Panulirus ornatus]|uniref:uncharacterized protein n=1 Tax=Panulirus ornatus TaxID=150431 RepID=UPI003A8B660C